MKKMGKWKVLLTGLIVGTLALGGCSGDDGDRGPQGERGPAGPGVQTAETCTVCHGQNRTADVEEHLLLGEVTTYDAEITSVDVTGATGAANVGVTVNFTVTDPATGQGVAGLTDDFEFTIAKWIEGDARNAGYWQSYINRSRTGPTNVLRAVGERRPATDLGGGNYSYTFVTNLGADGVGTFQYYGAANAPAGVGATAGIGDNGPLTSAAAQAVLGALDLAWDGAAVTRIAIASLSNPAEPEGYRFNAVADFIPNTGAIQNEFENWAATTESCNACHATTTPGAQMSLPNVHGDRRYEVALCVTCHNRNTFDRQASTNDAWVAIDMATLIHNIHRGAEGYLVDGRDYSGLPYPQDLSGVGGVMNCRTCHDNQLMEQPAERTPASAALWTEASIQGCGACHPVVGATQTPIAQHGGATDCSTCHPGVAPDAEAAHITNFATPNNPQTPPGVPVLEYQIASVAVNASNQPTVRFRVLADGAPVNLTATQPLPGGLSFSGTNPNFKITWSDPVGAVQAPADWTNTGGETRTYWDGNVNLNQSVADQPRTAGLAAIVSSLVGPDAEGYFTTAPGINPNAPLAFPANAALRAVFMEGTFNVAAGGVTRVISGESVIVGVDATDTPRRQIVDINSCNRCHERIRFHGGGGRDNNPDHCVTCHNPSMTSSNIQTETSNNFKDMIHAIHAGDRIGGEGVRENPYFFIRGNAEGTTGGQGPHDFSHVGYPSRLSDCRTCHLPGTYRIPLPANVLASTHIHDLADPAQSQKITPVTAACFACHDNVAARAHMTQNGGGFFVTQEEIDATAPPAPTPPAPQPPAEPPPTEPPPAEPPPAEPPPAEPPPTEPPPAEPPPAEPPPAEPPPAEPPPAEPPPAEPPPAIDGQALFITGNCTLCHGAAGEGGSGGSIQNSTLADLRGAPPFPPHNPINAWSDQQAQAVADYLSP